MRSILPAAFMSGDLALQRVVWKQVAGKLVDRELIEREVPG